ncbi:MAG: S8 family serine peptidase, partial [Ignavibacteriales bacterium]|nr:S8 family serine peptidase [Ignavibacteriales bacterium]
MRTQFLSKQNLWFKFSLTKLLIFLMLFSFSTLFAEQYIVVAKNERFNKSIMNQIKALGGNISKVHAKLGLAFVTSDDVNFLAKVSKLADIRSVIKDTKVQMIDPNRKVFAVENAVSPPNTGDDDFFFDLQWGHTAIQATDAWALGETGAGVRVVVLDDGIDSDHPDLAPNLNLSLCTSFVPGQTYEYNENYPGDPFSHGTHTSGTIAAKNNAYGTIGVAPDVELVMVKVLDSYTGSGYFSWIIDGIIYAADINADVISISIGGYAEKTVENAELLYALGRATLYADAHGSTIVASAGNDGENLDNYPGLYHLPSDAPKVISTSATAPIGWATDFNTSLDNLASYSNYGLQHVDFAAPGGDFIYPGDEYCTVAGTTAPCYVFDFVFSTGSNGGWYWSAGTSMATPHVSGVAALIIGAAGGSLPPVAVLNTLRRTSDDIGPMYRDLYFGDGRVNAKKAVMRINQLNKDAGIESTEKLIPEEFSLS